MLQRIPNQRIRHGWRAPENPPIGHSAVPDYFDEMLERIRDIRASERRVYLRVKEIFTMAADYRAI